MDSETVNAAVNNVIEQMTQPTERVAVRVPCSVHQQIVELAAARSLTPAQYCAAVLSGVIPMLVAKQAPPVAPAAPAAPAAAAEPTPSASARPKRKPAAKRSKPKAAAAESAPVAPPPPAPVAPPPPDDEPPAGALSPSDDDLSDDLDDDFDSW